MDEGKDVGEAQQVREGAEAEKGKKQNLFNILNPKYRKGGEL